MAGRDESDVVHHSGNAAVLKFALGLCLCYTLCVLVLRGFIRWRIYGVDDAIVLVSTILALAFFGCGYTSAALGLGRPDAELDLQQSSIEELNQETLAGNLTWIISLCISKVVIVAMLLRTTQTRSHRRVQHGVGLLIAAQCVVSVALLTSRCSHPSKLFWDFRSGNKDCPHKETRWLVLTILDILTEALLLLLPLQLVWRLKMDRRNRVYVIAAFWLRLPTLIFSIVRFKATNELRTTRDVSLTAAIVVVWQAVQLSYSLAAATIAALKRFTESMNTGFGHGELIRVHGTSERYQMSDQSGSRKRSKSSKSSSNRPNYRDVTVDSMENETELPPPRKGSVAAARPKTMQLRPEKLRNTATVSSPAKDVIMELPNSEASQDNTIRQEVQYSVQYSDAPCVELKRPQ
ncbi:hypothetical protein T440DRAFT_269565 [Plenodomus tracheiphilus IPT5]|uniref:Rhodopsin domain-containing protein n=1 Tax=Plenodomus tracheiphilus IPT5 TaxID=1408161 RepID=A0A6A7BFF5_9PLEO|nr:hypothetical protein T440DRAFT_269565 [Plenodomus tracheiphilus IPT5]